MCCHIFLLEGKVSMSLDDSIGKRRWGAMLWLLDMATTHSFPLPWLKPYLLNFIYRCLYLEGRERDQRSPSGCLPQSLLTFFWGGASPWAWSPRILLSLLPCARIQAHASTSTFNIDPGDPTQVFMLVLQGPTEPSLQSIRFHCNQAESQPMFYWMSLSQNVIKPSCGFEVSLHRISFKYFKILSFKLLMADLMPVYQPLENPNIGGMLFLIFWFSAMFCTETNLRQIPREHLPVNVRIQMLKYF